MKNLLFLALLLGISFSRIAAQTPIDALEAGLELVPTQQTVAAGENAVFEVRIGESAPPLDGVTGFDLQFELFPGVSPEHLIDFAGSCIPAAAQGAVMASYTASTHTIHVSLADVPAFTAGDVLFRISLAHAPGPVYVDQVFSAEGGFIIVEDIGFKQAGADVASTQPVVFPTHTHGLLHFDWKGTQPQSVTLVDVTGAQVVNAPATAIQAGYWATAGLPSGHYKVVIGYAAGRPAVQDVWVE